jgi:hypothetical protein
LVRRTLETWEISLCVNKLQLSGHTTADIPQQPFLDKYMYVEPIQCCMCLYGSANLWDQLQVALPLTDKFSVMKNNSLARDKLSWSTSIMVYINIYCPHPFQKVWRIIAYCSCLHGPTWAWHTVEGIHYICRSIMYLILTAIIIHCKKGSDAV